MWAPTPEKMTDTQCTHTFVRVADWASPPQKDALELWACAIVERCLAPLAAAMSPIESSSNVAKHAAHVLVELGMRAFVFYLEQGIFPELEAKAAKQLSLAKAGKLPASVRQSAVLV